MNQYKSHQHIPNWIAKMDGELLTSNELDVLDFLYWCKKHGCRTSNDHIGKYTHHQHNKVQEAIMKFYQLELVVIQNFGKRTRCIKVAPWSDRQAWENRPGGQGKVPDHPAPLAPHISPSRETPTGFLSRGEVNETSETDARNLSQGQRPRTPVCGSGGKPKPKPKPAACNPLNFQEVQALVHRDKLLKTGWSLDDANRIALVKYPGAAAALRGGLENKGDP